MAKYLALFSLEAEAVHKFMDHETDRATVVRKLAESAGGKLDAYYFMLGKYDGALIVDLPDTITAMAFSMAIDSTGTIKHIELHEMIPSDKIHQVVEKAKQLLPKYQPLGA
ncbi:MAG TPA: GYD domain-containing protein [Candidatus Xenobia bacterium]|jgi:uncharacterized protein with GYD domain